MCSRQFRWFAHVFCLSPQNHGTMEKIAYLNCVLTSYECVILRKAVDLMKIMLHRFVPELVWKIFWSPKKYLFLNADKIDSFFGLRFWYFTPNRTVSVASQMHSKQFLKVKAIDLSTRNRETKDRFRIKSFITRQILNHFFYNVAHLEVKVFFQHGRFWITFLIASDCEEKVSMLGKKNFSIQFNP